MNSKPPVLFFCLFTQVSIVPTLIAVSTDRAFIDADSRDVDRLLCRSVSRRHEIDPARGELNGIAQVKNARSACRSIIVNACEESSRKRRLISIAR
jgi:hypothetical protein